MRNIFVLAGLMISSICGAQELYLFTEPASNVPAKSISAKVSAMVMGQKNMYDNTPQRYRGEAYIGLSKKMMLKGGVSFSNMNTSTFKYESINLYGKYRFLSKDDRFKHFRMAAFGNIALSDAPFHYEEINLMGDKTGAELGVIATQLWHKFALSGSVSNVQSLDKSRSNDVVYVPERSFQAMNYSLSAGYLVLPVEYKSYQQTNFNVYAEFLAQQSLDLKTYYIDLAPGIQFIFNSNSKLNIAHRFQLSGDMNRMSKNSWMLSFEKSFLQAF